MTIPRGGLRLLYGAVLRLTIVVTIIPFLWIASASLKDFKAIAQGSIFFRPTVENYAALLQPGSDFTRFFLNSVTVTTLTTAVATVSGALTAYGLAKFRFPWGLDRYLLGWLLLVRMIHPIALVVPLFFLIKALHLYDTRIGLALAYIALALPFSVWMMRTFFDELPESLEEAALVDGCSHFGAFTQIVVPLVGPGLAATAILTFIFSWNDYLFGLILTQTPKAMTFPVAMARLIQEYAIQWGQISAAATVFALPAFVFGRIAQRHLIRGLTFGALKGRRVHFLW